MQKRESQNGIASKHDERDDRDDRGAPSFSLLVRHDQRAADRIKIYRAE